MPRPLDSRQLWAFCAVVRTGSFTKAARQVSLTQSAVSHAMKALEDEIGCRLLDRVGRKIELTEAGQAFFVRAQRITNEMGAAREEIANLGKWGRGNLRVGASTAICHHLIPPVLRQFKESYPDCKITIRPGHGLGLRELLRSNDVELAFGIRPAGEPQLAFRPLREDELKFIVSPAHPWAKAGKVTRAEIPRQNYIHYTRKSLTFQLIDRYFAAEKITLNATMELESMNTIPELVKAELGIGILAPWVAKKELADGSLVALPLGRRKLLRCWGILHLKERRFGMPEEKFMAVCASVADTLGR